MDQTQVVDKTPTFRRHPDTELLIRHLQTVSVGEKVSYGQLSHVIGRPIQENRGLLITARKALAEDRFFFLTENTHGLYRATDKEWMESRSSATRQRVKRLARRGSRDLTLVVADELSQEDRMRLALEQTVLGMHEALERPKVSSTMKMLCDAEGQRLQLKDAAQALREIL